MHLHNVPTEDEAKGSTHAPGVYEIELTKRDEGEHNAGVLIDQGTDAVKIRVGAWGFKLHTQPRRRPPSHAQKPRSGDAVADRLAHPPHPTARRPHVSLQGRSWPWNASGVIAKPACHGCDGCFHSVRHAVYPSPAATIECVRILSADPW